MLIVSLAIILIACEFFTNGIEWLGKKLSLGAGVVGSIFAAIGTCLPETLIPMIAILSGGDSEHKTDIGIGAIIGAPFMLSTLAFFITGLSVILFRRRRGTGMRMQVNTTILSRDIGYFIIIYIIGIATSFVPFKSVKYVVAVLLMAYYIFYIFQTVKNDVCEECKLEDLYAARLLKTDTTLGLVIFQIILALAGIVLGAKIFVSGIEATSSLFGISALVLSLIITPIATELPEKFNSIIWISKRKDTLALGNISGAMVFQSCIPVVVGMVFTSWQLDTRAVVSAILALLSSLLLYSWLKVKKSLNPLPLLAGGVFYAIFLAYLIMNGFH
jgi:cation:H+ antiporter